MEPIRVFPLLMALLSQASADGSFGVVQVVIGSSPQNQKCVTPPGPVDCPHDVMMKDRSGRYPDEFHIFHHGGQVCARRTDANAGWGFNVALRCQKTSSYYDSAGEVVFGSSLNSATKCVDSPGLVHCDDTAEQKGRTGEYPDKFHVYHEGAKICARRTDANAGWGLHLVVQCKSFGGPIFGGVHKGGAASGEVVFGSSLKTATKCVDSPGPVHCDDTAEQKGSTGEYPDKFHIYHDGAKICAHRTDADSGWGLHLVVQCKVAGGGSFSGGLLGGGSGGEVVFGSSLNSATKCVASPGPVHCDDSAEQKGRTGEYPDSFHIYHEGSQICAHRTDADAGWGLHLVIQCKIGGGGSFGGGASAGGGGGQEVVIGDSPNAEVKCVDAPTGVYCDDTAEQMGRTGEWPDTFHIYQENGRICAQRTDAHAGWGLNLVLNCQPYVPPPPGGWFRTEKIRHCCTEKLFSPACPYDCKAQIAQQSDSWTSKRQGWCCRNRGLGCQPDERAPPPIHGGHGPFDCEVPDTTPDHAPLPDQQGGGSWSPGADLGHPRYNCFHGNKEMWSQDKAQYCSLWLAASKVSGGGSFQAQYNCDLGDESSWSPEKTSWCHKHGGPHECNEAKSDQWDSKERDFCCIVKGIGCPKLSSVHVDLSQQSHDGSDRNSWEDVASLDIIDKVGAKPQPGTPHKLQFDCLDEKYAEWSETKKRWCCSKWGLFCQELGDFDCTSGLWNWRKGWSSEKKDYCCKKEGKACEDKSYDCTQEKTADNKDAREWCCENHLYSKACPFECHAGLDKWVVGFSPAKKAWCCKYEGLACVHGHPHPHAPESSPSHTELHVVKAIPHPAVSLGHASAVHHTLARPNDQLHVGEHEFSHADLGGHSKVEYTFADCQNKDDRPQDCVDWCCRMLGLCYLHVSFNCQVGVSSWHRWSSQKQSECCGNEVDCPSEQAVHYSSSHSFGGSAVWYHDRDVENLHIGASPEKGTKCVTPSKPIMCPVDAGNRREDSYPDRFRVYRKGGQVCADREDYKHLWGLDLVLKCIKVDEARFEKVRIGSSLDSSLKCVQQTSPVTCEDDAAQAGRTDPHPDTFNVYHSGGQICARRIDANSHWGLDLVLYCRRGGWNSGFWATAGERALEDSYSEEVRGPSARSLRGRLSLPMLAILPGFCVVLLGALFYSMSCKRLRAHGLLLQADEEDANSSRRKARTPWVSVPTGDEGGEELEVA